MKLTQDQRDEIDWKVFWHSGGPDSIAHWGIYEAERLIALSSASDKGHNIYEIGVDATQGSQAKGLGSAVVSAAGNWILEQGATPFASAADWNIPSGRNLRNLGLQYTYSALISWKGEFMVPPQPIGQPLPGQQVYDKYPRWAMNKDFWRIQSRRVALPAVRAVFERSHFVGSRNNQMLLVCEHHDLRSIAHVELRKHPLHVRFHRSF